jgi:tetraacyldisaccharide 4'-kinase
MPPIEAGRQWENYLLGIITGQRRGWWAGMGWGLLRGASGLYRLGLAGNRALYRWGFLRPTRLPAWVVSVGNLTLGGTGKTSCVLWLARQYRAAGRRVAILSRGHGRRSREAVGVVSDGQRVKLGVEEAGDEPVLMARTLEGVPVLVGKNRVLTGRYAIEHFGSEVLILDDGFQYWRLEKDLEIVLVDATDPFGPSRRPDRAGHLLPAGTLREPPSHLNRADLIWITRSDCVAEAVVEALAADLQAAHPAIPVLRTWHRPIYLRPLPSSDPHPPTLLQGRRICALSSIGNPGAFEQTLRRLGIAELLPARFADHHRYRPAELQAVAAAARQRGLEWIVTTEKDATRLSAVEGGPVELPLPVWVLGIEVVLPLDDRLKRQLGLITATSGPLPPPSARPGHTG